MPWLPYARKELCQDLVPVGPEWIEARVIVLSGQQEGLSGGLSRKEV